MKLSKVAKELLGQVSDFLFGYDFFISYAHDDGDAYGKQLAAELRHFGYSVFLDTDVYTLGTDLRLATRRRVRMSRYFIVLARMKAMESIWVREIQVAMERRRTPVLTDFNKSVAQASPTNPIRALLEGHIYVTEERTSGNADPSDSVIEALQKAFKATRVETRRTWVISFVAITLLVIGLFARWEWIQKNQERDKARMQLLTIEARRQEEDLTSPKKIAVGGALAVESMELASNGAGLLKRTQSKRQETHWSDCHSAFFRSSGR
jgi:hypothetical protein